MQNKIQLSKKNIIITVLCTYFISKMLWDKFVPNVFEFTSLALIGCGIVMFFCTMKKQGNMAIVTLYFLFSGYVLFDGLLKDTTEYIARSIYEYIFYFAMIFAMSYYLRRCNLERLIRIIHRFGFVIALLSWYEYLTKNYLIGLFTNVINYQGAAYGFRAAVFSRSYLSHGMVLGFIAICAYYMFLKTDNKKYLVSTFFCWASILTTSSRGPLVATFNALLVIYIVNQYRENSKIDKKVLTWGSIILVALIVFLFLTSSFTTGNEFIDYFLFRMRQIINWTGDAGNVGRIRVWKEALKWFEIDRIFGIGPSKTGSWGSASLGVTESGLLKHLCELGIIGFIIYYAFVIAIIKKGITKYRTFSMERKIDSILFFGIVIMVLNNNITLQSTEEIMVSFIYSLGMGGLLLDA